MDEVGKENREAKEALKAAQQEVEAAKVPLQWPNLQMPFCT